MTLRNLERTDKSLGAGRRFKRYHVDVSLNGIKDLKPVFSSRVF